MTAALLTDAAIDAISAAVFAKPDPFVVEAYSESHHTPRQFTAPEAMASYAKEQVTRPNGLAFFFVVYPDMGGSPIQKTIQLDPQNCSGQRLRYTWDGWGLISIQLRRGDDPNCRSHISVNSDKRANAWASTFPDWKAPDTWNWKAIASHTRRLQRVLKKVA